jgi:hypothetical protein
MRLHLMQRKCRPECRPEKNVYHACRPLIALCLSASLLVPRLRSDILVAVRPECSFFSPVNMVLFNCVVIIRCLSGIGFEVQEEIFHDLSRVEYEKNYTFSECGNTTDSTSAHSIRQDR